MDKPAVVHRVSVHFLNPKTYYSVYKVTPLAPALIQLSTVHILTASFFTPI
jgi:hypothetical protein